MEIYELLKGAIIICHLTQRAGVALPGPQVVGQCRASHPLIKREREREQRDRGERAEKDPEIR